MSTCFLFRLLGCLRWPTLSLLAYAGMYVTLSIFQIVWPFLGALCFSFFTSNCVASAARGSYRARGSIDHGRRARRPWLWIERRPLRRRRRWNADDPTLRLVSHTELVVQTARQVSAHLRSGPALCAVFLCYDQRSWAVSYTHLTLPTIYSV